MLNRIKNTLAYRLPLAYKRWLNLKPISKLPAKPNAATVVITMTGKGILNMTRLSVLSIAKSWSMLPRLIITTDGTISTREVRERLSFWPGELIVHDWDITEKYHMAKGRVNLLEYAGKHIMGRKMAVILHQAALNPVVWIDSDVLFYNDFLTHIPNCQGFFCGGSEEAFSVYDERALQFFNNDLNKRYKFNAGMLFIGGGDICERFELERLLHGLADYTHYFTEQTTFAHIASQSLGIIWPMNVIKNFNSDNQQIAPMPKKNIVARHYTINVRHLFWRDAFFNL